MRVCGCSLPTFVAILAVVFGYVGLNLRAFVRVSKTDTKSFQKRAESCHSLAGTDKKAPSCEDFRFVSENIIIAGNGDTTNFLDHGDVAPGVTSMALIELTSERYRDVALGGFPSDITFRPHGLKVTKGRLFVVNHADNGVERVEVFEIHNQDSFDNFSLKWIKAVFPPVPLKTLNSVTAVSDDEIYVTHWLPFSLSPGGMEAWKGFKNGAIIAAQWLNLIGLKMLGVPVPSVGLTAVYRCIVSTGKCEKAYGGFIAANGIDASPDGKFIFVCDVLKGSLTVFARDPSTGKLTFRMTQYFDYEPDNVMISNKPSKNGKYELWMGTLGDFLKYVAKQHPIYGGLLVAEYDPKTNTMAVDDYFIHDGGIKSGIATGGKWGDHVILTGPKKGGGLAFCDIKADRS